MYPAELCIETSRLLLRLPRVGDFEGFAEMMADAEAARFIGGPLSRELAWRKFLQGPGAWAIQGFAMFAVIERSSGQWLGQAGPWHPEGWPGNEVGWMFRRAAWHRGHATEAATAAIDWTFAELGWSEMIHCIVPENTPSQRLAARLGSRRLGNLVMPPPYAGETVEKWGQSRAEWQSRRRQGFAP